MARQRKRVNHTATFEERLAEEAIRDGRSHQWVAEIARTAAPYPIGKLSVRSEEVRPYPQCPELARGPHVKDYEASLEKLRSDAAEAALIRDLATDMAKREMFDRLAQHLDQLADDVERAMNVPKASQELSG
jgi:hypothetical protein